MTSKSTEFESGLEAVQNNLFLNLLKPVKGEGGKPSLLTFNNNESFEANQEAIYTSFKELISEDRSLPRIMRNGKSEYYSTRLLAQEMIAYSYASGGVVQGAVEFHKYLPIEYLDDMTRTSKRGITSTISENLRRYNAFNAVDKNMPTELEQFQRQYFQNNPDSAEQTAVKEIKLGDGSLVYESKTAEKNYVAVRNTTRSKLKSDKWSLYERIDDSSLFRKIDILGDTGMAEYEFAAEELASMVNEEVPIAPKLSDLEMETISDERLGNIPEDGSKIIDFLDAIAKGEYGEYEHMREIADYLRQFVDADTVFNYTNKPVAGTVENGQVYLNPANITSRVNIGPTFIHEVTHLLTIPYLRQYVDKMGELRTDITIPAELQGLNSVYNTYKNAIIVDHAKEYEEFQEKMVRYYEARSSNLPFSEDFTDLELDLFYPATSLPEFIATALGNNKNFLAKAKGIPYLATNQSIMRKFGHFITNLIKRIGKIKNIPENTVALQALASGLDVVEAAYNKEQQDKKPVQAEPALSDTDTQKIVENYQNNEPPFDESFYVDLNDNTGDPSNDTPDADSVAFLPMIQRTKNKCN